MRRLLVLAFLLPGPAAVAQGAYIQNDDFAPPGQINATVDFVADAYQGPGVILTPTSYPVTVVAIDVLAVGYGGAGDGQQGAYIMNVWVPDDGGFFTAPPDTSDGNVVAMDTVQLSTSSTQFNDIVLLTPVVLNSGNLFVEIQDQLDSVDDGTTIALDLGPQVPGVNFIFAGGLKDITDAGPMYAGNWIVRARLQVQVSLLTITPSSGTSTSPVPVTITGTGFDSSCTLDLRRGSSPTSLTGVSFISDSELQATVPSGLSAGVYDLGASCMNGLATLAGAYTVEAPDAGSGTSSSTSTTASSTSSSVSGTSTSGATTVSSSTTTTAVTTTSGGSTSATSTSAVSSSTTGPSSSTAASASSTTASSSTSTSSLTGSSVSSGGTSSSGSGHSGSGSGSTSSGSTSSGASGGASSGSGSSSTTANSGAVQLTAIAPTSGPTNAATPATVEGANFTLGVQVLLGSTLLTDLSVRSTSVLSVTVPAGIAPGTYDVSAVNPDGSRAVLHSAFTVSAASSHGTAAKGCGCGPGATPETAALWSLLAAGFGLSRRRSPKG